MSEGDEERISMLVNFSFPKFCDVKLEAANSEVKRTCRIRKANTVCDHFL